jgi:hypothetical protein
MKSEIGHTGRIGRQQDQRMMSTEEDTGHLFGQFAVCECLIGLPGAVAGSIGAAIVAWTNRARL